MPGTLTYTFDTDKEADRCRTIIRAIGRSGKIIVMCGAGISTASGIPDSRSPGGLLGKTCTVDGRQVKYADLFHNYSTLEGGKLAAFNILMTRLRKTARSAPLGNFHKFLHRAFDEGRVIQCLTRNFDGLETRDRPDLIKRVIMVHGDNRVLRCCSPDCAGVFGKTVTNLDRKLASGELVECMSCVAAETKQSARRNRPKGTSKHLRPAVLADEGLDYDLQAGKQLSKLLDAADNCDLLLVVGTSLKSEAFGSLVRDVARRVHSGEGVVVYIDRESLNARKWAHHVDFHLRLDIEQCAGLILECMDEIDPESMIESESESWQELIDNVVPGELEKEEDLPEENRCYLCMFSVEENIVKCILCARFLCCKFVGERKGATCVKLFFYSQAPPVPSLEEVRSSFICPYCWDHSENRLYPHYLRTNPRLYVAPFEGRTPRMAMIVYYLAEFWPITSHFVGLVTMAWKTEGWGCFVQPIQLQQLDQCEQALSTCPWEQGTFDAFVVYITHGMSSTRKYQISNISSCTPVEFFQLTLQPARQLLERALSVQVFHLCCGHPFASAANINAIQHWIDSEGLIQTVVGCFNQKLAPAFMLGMVAKASVQLIGYEGWSTPKLLDLWLLDDLAATHSDLICFSRNEAPVMWLFSPFQTRPLGKELPSVITTCTCTLTEITNSSRPAHERVRRIWKVTHDGKDGKPLRDIKVKGKLHRMGGLYAAVVPCFSS